MNAIAEIGRKNSAQRENSGIHDANGRVLVDTRDLGDEPNQQHRD